MKAICVTPDRKLEVREIPAPDAPPTGHVIVKMDASAINHGDKTFLARPDAVGGLLAGRQFAVWGASGAGAVIAAGPGVTADCVGKTVAIYRSLSQSPDTVGLWCEWAQVPITTCLILPQKLSARDYCGSLVNVFTAYAFLDEVVEQNHKGIIVTAGNSATGYALAALARRRSTPVIALVRSKAAQDRLRQLGVEHAVNVTDDGFESALRSMASEVGATAVFDGVGGDLVTRIAPVLPMNSTIYFYGFLSAATPVSFPSFLVMARNLVLKRFSNFDSATAKDGDRFITAMSALQGCIEDPLFRTRIGKEFRLDQIDEAIAYENRPGAKAVLVP
jgi:NADPH2:quinone reductase